VDLFLINNEYVVNYVELDSLFVSAILFMLRKRQKFCKSATRHSLMGNRSTINRSLDATT
jgi:hypothetical protein